MSLRQFESMYVNFRNENILIPKFKIGDHVGCHAGTGVIYDISPDHLYLYVYWDNPGELNNKVFSFNVGIYDKDNDKIYHNFQNKDFKLITDGYV